MRFIKGQALGKLTGCERELAITLPSWFRLLFLLSFISKTKSARLKNPTDLPHKNLMKPLISSTKHGYPAAVVQAGYHHTQQIDQQLALQTSQKENNERIPITLATTQ